jgi:hypothetical protein
LRHDHFLQFNRGDCPNATECSVKIYRTLAESQGEEKAQKCQDLSGKTTVYWRW